MTTVVSRTFRSSPHRDALQTWDAIVELLTQGKDGTARSELRAVTGVAASLIADQAPKSAPIVATCDGPRTRIYCLFDEDAIDGDDANEEVLGFEPLKETGSLAAVSEGAARLGAKRAQKHSSRIIARDLSQGIATQAQADAGQALSLDLGGFLKS